MWFGKGKVGEHIRRGDRANASKSWSAAEASYRQALDINPRLPQIWVQYGHSLKEQGKLGEAERAYREAISLSKDADCYLQLGHALKLQGQFEEAALAYRAASKLNPKLSDAADELARLGAVTISKPAVDRLVRVQFDVRRYARECGIEVGEALLHYVTGGFRHYRSSGGAADATPYAQLNTRLLDDHYREIYDQAFDPLFYWEQYPDLWDPQIDPLDHFHIYGWREGRDPSADFSVSHYLAGNWDVRDAGIDPFVHYLLFGRLLGRPTAKSSASRPPDRSALANTLDLDAAARTVSERDLYRFCRTPAKLVPPCPTFVPDALDLHFVVPDFSKGSGGHMNIFRICSLLEAKGHKITIWVRDPAFHGTADAARETLYRHFQVIQGPVRFVADGFAEAEGDVVLATDWRSVSVVMSAAKFKCRFYFVQDFEPAFHPAGTLSLLAESTYRLGLDCICGGPWLEELMRERYGLWARKFWQAADASVYRRVPDAAPATGLPRIAFYARNFTQRRAVELGLLALEVLAERGVKFHVDFFGQKEPLFPAAPYPATHHGVLDGPALAEIYGAATIGMALSATNYSIIPQEMMACGLAVLDIAVESTRAVYPGIVRLADPSPLAIADALESLLSDEPARAAQVRRAAEWVGQFSWPRSADLVEAALAERLAELSFVPTKPAIQRAKSYFASVVIPTYNGGEILPQVVDKVLRQRLPGEVQLICIDSSSQDGSNEYLRDRPGVDLVTIEKQEFQHGRTRNLGVEMAKSEFVAFLTQDALPCDETWLYNLVSMLKNFPTAGGVFGRHIAYDSSSPFIRRDIDRHFAQFADEPPCIDPRDQSVSARWSEQSFRQKCHFYSDNNSCLRKSIWRAIPIPELDFGEDQAFAFNLLKAGYGKAYAQNAVVFHSHDDPAALTEQRAYEETTFYYRHFGYRFVSSELDAQRELFGRKLIDTAWARARGIGEDQLQRRLEQNRARVAGGVRAMRDAQVLRAATGREEGQRVLHRLTTTRSIRPAAPLSAVS